MCYPFGLAKETFERAASHALGRHQGASAGRFGVDRTDRVAFDQVYNP
jgi:hypothetical protein